ncbi:hypothetical protein AMTRI_Chr07g79310 [Amborella trichopoda]
MTVVIEMRDVVGQKCSMPKKSNNVDVRTMCSFEDHAMQEEIISSFQYLTSRKDDGTYEFTSIICRHSLHVLFKENFIQIPDRYLPKRWRRSTSLISNVSSSTSTAYVARVKTIQSLASTIGTKGARFDDCHKFIMEQFSRILEHVEEVECMRPSMDENRFYCESIHVKKPFAKKPRYCKVPSCGQIGHGYRNCPLRRGQFSR